MIESHYEGFSISRRRRFGARLERAAHAVLRQERRISLEVRSPRASAMRETLERDLRERRGCLF